MLLDWINALVGGVLIGVAVSVMLVFNGRVTGISGILSGSLFPVKGDIGWRILFISGLIFGGVFLLLLKPEVFAAPEETPTWRLITAGLLVGFGTLLGNGCTSGHGVCGVSRLSMRSIIATITFIVSGVLAVGLVRYLGGLS